MAIAYTVIATFPTEHVRKEYLDWLVGGHVDAVIAAGAESANVVKLDRPADLKLEPLQVEVRYVFSSREQLERYLSQHAPGLRAEGLKRFPPECGVTFRRSVGEIV